MQWTRLADLPVPMHSCYVAVQDNKVYITGVSANDDALHKIYAYDINTDYWDQLPVSGHYFCIPQIIGNKLVIIGGCLSTTKKRTNKVSTFDEASQTWISYYPDMLSARSKPGVVTHQEYVIAAGGTRGEDFKQVQDDIELLNWPENTGWKRVSTTLPVPMYDISMTISDGYLVIVNYFSIDSRCYSAVHATPISDVITSQYAYRIKPKKWVQLIPASHWAVALVPHSLPLMVLGGIDSSTIPTADIKMYDSSSKSWKSIKSSLTFPRLAAAVAAVNDTAVIVIGGCTNMDTTATAKSSSLTTVELGQAKLL